MQRTPVKKVTDTNESGYVTNFLNIDKNLTKIENNLARDVKSTRRSLSFSVPESSSTFISDRDSHLPEKPLITIEDIYEEEAASLERQVDRGLDPYRITETHHGGSILDNYQFNPYHLAELTYSSLNNTNNNISILTPQILTANGGKDQQKSEENNGNIVGNFENLTQKQSNPTGTEENAQTSDNSTGGVENTQNQSATVNLNLGQQPTDFDQRRRVNGSLESLESEGDPERDNNGNNNNNNSIASDSEDDNDEMALSLAAIMKGIPKFIETYDGIQQFVADSDLICELVDPAQEQTTLRIIKTRLTTAHKLGDISNDSWAQIKVKLREKYRMTMTYETAQERLLAIRQGQKESIDAYAERVKKLLDALNIATLNDDANIQGAARIMNEEMAVRKFKQNIFDQTTRTMALSVTHTSLYEAIAHATEKQEQMQLSNIVKDQTNEQKANNKNNNSNNNNNNNNNNKNNNSNRNNGNNKNNDNKKPQCMHCKKNNHSSDRCFFRPKTHGNEQTSQSNGQNNQQGYKQRATNAAKASKSMSASASAEDAQQSDEEQTYEANVASGSMQMPFELNPMHLNSERWVRK